MHSHPTRDRTWICRQLGGLAAAIALAMTAVVAPAGTPDADPDRPAAAVFAQVCSHCHGPDGNAPPGSVPIIAGQQAEFLRRQLRAFKTHARSDEETKRSMWPVAHELGERQIGELAAFASAQPWRQQAVQGTRERIAAGAAVFARDAAARGVQSCSGCHGADGRGTVTAPRVAGQHADYLARQLELLQHTNDRPGAKDMRSAAHSLTPDDIAAVAAYLQALPQVGAR